MERNELSHTSQHHFNQLNIRFSVIFFFIRSLLCYDSPIFCLFAYKNELYLYTSAIQFQTWDKNIFIPFFECLLFHVFPLLNKTICYIYFSIVLYLYNISHNCSHNLHCYCSNIFLLFFFLFSKYNRRFSNTNGLNKRQFSEFKLILFSLCKINESHSGK